MFIKLKSEYKVNISEYSKLGSHLSEFKTSIISLRLRDERNDVMFSMAECINIFAMFDKNVGKSYCSLNPKVIFKK